MGQEPDDKRDSITQVIATYEKDIVKSKVN
jgi:hypothetical protein